MYFKKSTSLKKKKTSGKNQRNRVLNLKLEALDVVELMELMEPVRSREVALSETCVIVHRMQKKSKTYMYQSCRVSLVNIYKF